MTVAREATLRARPFTQTPTGALLRALLLGALMLGAAGSTGCKSKGSASGSAAPAAWPMPPVTVQTLVTTVPRGNVVDALNDGHVLFAGPGRLDDIALEIGMDTVHGPAAPVALRGIARTSDGTLLGWQVPERRRTGKQLSMVLYALPPGAKA